MGKKREAERVAEARKREHKVGAIHSYTTKEWRALRDSTKGYCMMCKEYVGLNGLQLDHITPLVNSQKDFVYTINDIQALCGECNSLKSCYPMDDIKAKFLHIAIKGQDRLSLWWAQLVLRHFNWRIDAIVSLGDNNGYIIRSFPDDWGKGFHSWNSYQKIRKLAGDDRAELRKLGVIGSKL